MAPLDINQIRNRIKEELNKIKFETKTVQATITHDIVEILEETTTEIASTSTTSALEVLDVQRPFLEDFVNEVLTCI